MTSCRPGFCTSLAGLGLLLGCVLLFELGSETSRTGGWTNNVLRNWEEHGFFKLGGKLVMNPGGFEATTHPEVYGGHRPGCLYPSFVVGHLSGGAGERVLPFYLLLTAGVIASVVCLLGGGSWALFAAALLVFSPGYVRAANSLDPLVGVVLLGFPVLFACQRILQADTLTPSRAALLVVIVVLFTSMNWTSLFVYAGLLGWLLACRPGGFPRFFCFAAVTVIAVLVVAVISVLDKTTSQATDTGVSAAHRYFNSYLMGAVGYDGAPMSWHKALLRLGSVGLVSLLPVWGLYVTLLLRAFRNRRAALASLIPMGTSALSILGMRNYFAHHPWMAPPVLMVGLVLAMQILLKSTPPPRSHGAATPGHRRHWAMLGLALLALAYGAGVTVLTRMNSIDLDQLVAFIRNNTRRSDAILIPDGETWLINNSDRLAAIIDRQIVAPAVDRPLTTPEQGLARKSYWLTTMPLSDRPAWVASSSASGIQTNSVASRLLEWYRSTIARRKSGDRLAIPPNYFLYEPKAADPEPPLSPKPPGSTY